MSQIKAFFSYTPFISSWHAVKYEYENDLFEQKLNLKKTSKLHCSSEIKPIYQNTFLLAITFKFHSKIVLPSVQGSTSKHNSTIFNPITSMQLTYPTHELLGQKTATNRHIEVN